MFLTNNRSDIEKWKLWIEESHPEKIKWAIDYISKKVNKSFKMEHKSKNLFINLINEIPESPENTINLNKMMAAWRAKKHKEKTNREISSFLLEEKTRSKISRLAKKSKQSQSKVIEEAIFNHDRDTKEINKEVKSIVESRITQKEKLTNAKKRKEKREIKRLTLEIELLREKNAKIKAGYISMKSFTEEIILEYNFGSNEEEHEAIQDELWKKLNLMIEKFNI
ncbi:hypothetical protein [Oceanisphaera pacifica]|uniref:Uncharacterized protein n=1 Tax=Oceanisphaera pacifica TaxID=2818389 RepID=A0ABS3NBZ1_9GAMM|nr:hypothetical protein [Oceanisphaera pacifica]MBO1518107.1 hypothetical protein [Oceanisphaera pacifica]